MMNAERKVQPPPLRVRKRLAGFWIRLGAYIIDSFILLIPSLAAVFFIKNEFYYLLIAIGLGLYKPICEAFLGGTAGKISLGIRVEGLDGELVELSRAIIRNGVFILPMIANTVIQMKMIEKGISPFQAQASLHFQESNEVLTIASYAFSFITALSCAYVLLNSGKRALHDLIGHTRVVYYSY